MSKVVLVDERDNDIGLKDTVEAHLGQGDLHRAFAVFVFNSSGKTLVAKRSAGKMLWPLIWDSACASHPERGESYEEAGERRLIEELGFTCKLKNVDRFQYEGRYSDIGAEKEVCVTLIGEYDGVVKANPEEVAEFKWMDINQLKASMSESPYAYTVWFKIALDRLIEKGIVKL